MKNKFTHFLVGFIVLAIAVSCKDKKPQTPPVQKIKVVKVLQKDVPIYNEFVGQIYGKLDIPIRARVEGYLEKIHFKEGTRVKKGTLLYTIDAKPFLEEVAAKESQVAEARTVLIQSESDLRRIKPLAEMDAVSQRELDMAQAKRDAAKAALKAAEADLNLAQINLGYTKVYAPITGVIGKTEADAGEFVGRSPNPVILNTISNITSVRVQFFLSERQFLMFSKEHARAEKENEANTPVEIKMILADDSIYEHVGRVDFIDRSVNPSTGSIMLQASFPNPERLLRPGQFARLKIQVDLAKGALLVPQKTVNELQGQYSVFVVNDKNEVESKIVEVGAKSGEYWIIEKGIDPGDKVVLEGLQRVQPGMKIEPELVEFKGDGKE